MNNNSYDIVDLIGKRLANEATVEENAILDNWLSQDEENRVYFRQFKSLFDNASSLRGWQSFDSDAAWRTMKSKLIQKKQKQRSLFDRYWPVAASVAIFLGLGYASYTFLKPRQVIALKTQEVIEQDTLPDGTVAFMNKNTSLAYQYNPLKKSRTVKLKGEAFFETGGIQSGQFIIETNELFIEDVGTSFNVKAYPGNQTVEVYVGSGEVAMYTDTNPGIRIGPGEKGAYTRATGVFSKQLAGDDNVLAYKTRSFEFRGSRLADLVAALNEVYDRKIRIGNPELDDCRITVAFRHESIEVIAEVIAETLQLELSEKDGDIVLLGNGCPH